MPSAEWAGRAGIWVLVLAALCVLTLAVALIPFTEPLADDFCRAILEPVAHARKIYFGWSGRWFGIISSIAILVHTGITENYPYLVAGLFALTVAAWLLFAWALVGGRWSVRDVLLAGLALFVLFWVGMPSPGETIYWAIGGIENHFGLFFAIGFLALMSWALGTESRARRGLLLAAALIMALLATGCHEAAALSLSAIVVVAVASAFYLRSDGRYLWLLAAVVVLAGTAVAVGAPGNLNRARFFPESGSVTRALEMVAWGGTTVILPWFLDIKIWAASVIFLGLSGAVRAAPLWLRDPTLPWRWGIPLLTIAILGGILTAAGWGSGSPGPARLHNFMYALFLIGWAMSLLAWAERLPPAVHHVCAGPGMAAAPFVLAAGLLAAPNTTNAIHDFARNSSHDVAAWQAAIEEREDFIRQAKAEGATDVVVPAPPVHPWSFTDADLSLVIGAPQNACPARYYGLETLGVEPRAIEVSRPKPRS